MGFPRFSMPYPAAADDHQSSTPDFPGLRGPRASSSKARRRRRACTAWLTGTFWRTKSCAAHGRSRAGGWPGTDARGTGRGRNRGVVQTDLKANIQRSSARPEQQIHSSGSAAAAIERARAPAAGAGPRRQRIRFGLAGTGAELHAGRACANFAATRPSNIDGAALCFTRRPSRGKSRTTRGGRKTR